MRRKIEYTKRFDGKYNRWEKMSAMRLKTLDIDTFNEMDRPEWMNPFTWVITGVYDKLPRNIIPEVD